MSNKKASEILSFFHLSLPFSIVNGVVWGVGIIIIPLLAGSTTRAGLSFSMINLGIALGAVGWGKLSHYISVNKLVFASSLVSFIAWSLITILNGQFIVPLSLLFGIASAGIFVLSSVIVTQRYERTLWEKYISMMQAFMTGGTVVGLLITSVYASPITGIALLFLATVSYLPILHHHKQSTPEHTLHHSVMKPKMHFSELFTAYFHRHFRLRHLLALSNKYLLLLNSRWALALLSVAPVYAIYPLLMKNTFHIEQHISSLIYAVSTGIGVYLFLVAGKLSKIKGASLPFNIATLLYFFTFVLMGLSIILRISILGALGFVIMIFGWSFISVGMNVSIVETVGEEKRAEALGVANSIQSLDNMAGGIIAGVLSSSLGNASIIAFGLAFSFLAAVSGTIKIKEVKNAI